MGLSAHPFAHRITETELSHLSDLELAKEELFFSKQMLKKHLAFAENLKLKADLEDLEEQKRQMLGNDADLKALLNDIEKLQQFIATQEKREVALATAERWDIAKKTQSIVTKPISFMAALGKGAIELSHVFMDVAKGVFSPFDYLMKGGFAIRDYLVTPATDPLAQMKKRVALATVAGCGLFVGGAITVAVHSVFSLPVLAAALVTIPIAAPIVLVGISAIGFYKEKKILARMQEDIVKEKVILAQQEKTLSRLSTLQETERDYLRVKIQRQRLKINQMVKSARYQSRRVNSSMVVTTGFVVAAFGLLFPPLLVVGAAMVVGAVLFDVGDKWLQRRKAATARKQQQQRQAKLSRSPRRDDTIQEKERDKLKHKEMHVDEIQIMLGAKDAHAQHSQQNIAKARQVTIGELKGLNEVKANEAKQTAIAAAVKINTNITLQQAKKQDEKEGASDKEGSTGPHLRN